MSASGSTRRPASRVETVTHDNERLVPQVRKRILSQYWMEHVTHNKCLATCGQFAEAARDFLRGICQYLCSAIWKIFRVSTALYAR